jgi:hypothetical protein
VHITHASTEDGVRQHHEVEFGANLLRHPKRFEEERSQVVMLLLQKAVKIEEVQYLWKSDDILGHDACHRGSLTAPKDRSNPPQLRAEVEEGGRGVPVKIVRDAQGRDVRLSIQREPQSESTPGRRSRDGKIK